VDGQDQQQNERDNWRSPKYAHLRGMLPDPAVLAAARVIYANPKLTAEFNRAANITDSKQAQRALSRVISRVLATRQHRSPRRRGAGRPRARRLVRTASRGGDSGDDSSSGDGESDPPVGGALVGARRRAA
jgi:hypothetical protein